MKNNKGYSLIELVVIVAIIAVLAGGTMISVQLINGYYAKECAKNLESQINKVQILNMARKTTELEFGQDTQGYYYAQITENKGTPQEHIEKKQIGRKSLKITYSMDSTDSNEFELKYGLATNPICVKFKRTTGELLTKDGSDDIGFHRVWIRQSAGGRCYTVTVNTLTGKVEVTPEKVKYE